MLCFILATFSFQTLATDNVMNIQLTASSPNDGPAQDGKDPVTPNQFSATLNNRMLTIATTLSDEILVRVNNIETKKNIINERFTKVIQCNIEKYGSYEVILQFNDIQLIGTFNIKLSKEDAINIACNMFEKELVEIFISKEIYLSKDTIHYHDEIFDGYIITDTDAWVAFVDIYPTANWSHDCQYLLIDATTGKVKIYDKTDIPTNRNMHFDKCKSYDYKHGFIVETSQDAFEIADSLYKNEKINIYTTRKVKHKGTIDLAYGDSILLPTISVPYYIAFIDLYPEANWSHPCDYLLINSYSGQVITIHKEWFPLNMDEFTLWRSDSTNTTNIINPSDIIVDSNNNKKHHKKLNNNRNNNSNKWAIIISGGIDIVRNYYRYWNDCSLVYKTLIHHGYDIDDIYVAISDGISSAEDMTDIYGNPINSLLDLNSDGVDDIRYNATRNGIIQLFEDLQNVIQPNDEVFIFTTDHGGLSGTHSTLSLWNNEILYDYEFATLIENLNAGIVNIVMEQCHSGGFIDDFYGSNFNNVVITTSSTCEQLSWSRNDYYDEFIYWWCTAVNGITPDGNTIGSADYNTDGHISMQEAYIFASAHDERNETPMQHSNDNCLPTALTLTQILDICDNYTLINGYDIYIKDDNSDFGFEPNTVTKESWIAPNIWFEDLNGNKVNTLYQGQTYKINTRIYNRGDQASPGGETIYWHWTKAMIGGSWPHSWFEQYEYTCGENSVIRGALINPDGTTLPSINGGDSYVISEYWTVPVIDYSACAEFADDIDQLWHYCIMARIIDAQSQPGEDMAEQTLTSIVLDNNNVASCNFSIFNNQHLSNDSIPAAIVGLTAPNMTTGYYHIYCDLLSSNIDLANNIHIYLTLSHEMYNNWSMNGNGYVDINNQGKLEITANHAELLNLYINGNGLYPIKIELDNTNSLNTEVSFDIYLVNNNGDIIGGERFKYYGNGVNYYETIPYRQYGEESSSNQISICCAPNPAETFIQVKASEKILSINIYNTHGHKVISSDNTNINIVNLPKGLYLVQAKTAQGNCQTKFVKL